MARPLTRLLKNDVEWSWTDDTEAAFQHIKTSLMEAPILAVLDDSKEYSVVCDASDFAISCALLQKDENGHERVVTFQSRQLQAAEKNYPVHDKELLAMKYALVKFRLHLLGSLPFVVYTDHTSLRTATQSPHLSPRMARWLSFFSEYNFAVEYKPGRLNVLADALSRRPDYELNHITSLDVYELIRDAYASDPHCAALIRALSHTDGESSLAPRVRAQLHRYSFSDGLLRYRVAGGEDARVVVPADENLRYVIAYGAHDAPGSGHLGGEKTYSLLRPRFWWPKMYKWVSRYVRSCDVCQRAKPRPQLQAPLQRLPVPSYCWRSISMDFFFGLPRTAAGLNGVFVFVDRLSRVAHLVAVSDAVTGADCAKLFVDTVFRHHGIPDSIVSDRDPRFTGDFWEGLFQTLDTRLDMSTTDHPETDGQIERANRVVEDILRSYCAQRPASWYETLLMVEFAVNNAVQASTGLSPFFVNGLRHPALPLCLMGSSKSGEGGARRLLASQLTGVNKPAERRKLDEFLSLRVDVITSVRDAMAAAQDLQKEQADKRGRKNTTVFNEEDFVLVSTKNLSKDAISSVGSTKLLPRFLGPFKVLKKSGNSYKIDLLSWLQTHPTFYVGLLKPYLENVESENDRESATAAANAREKDSAVGSAGTAQPGLEENPMTSTSAPPDPLEVAQVRSDDTRVDDSRPEAPAAAAESPGAMRDRRRSGGLGAALGSSSARTDGRGSTNSPPPQGCVPRQQDVASDRDPTTESSTTIRTRRRRAIRPVRAPLPVLDRAGEAHYQIERLEKARSQAGLLELLVKWLGYPHSQTTWPPAEQLRVDCFDLVRAAEQYHPEWFL